MATVTRTWDFTSPSSSQGWILSPGGSSGQAVTMGYITFDGFPQSGCLETRIPAGTKLSTCTGSSWFINGTWEALFGIPPNSTILSATGSYNWAIGPDVLTGAACTTGPFVLNVAIGGLVGVFSSGSGAGSTNAPWATIAGVGLAVPVQNQPSSCSMQFQLQNSLAVGNSTSALIAMHHDQVVVTVSFTPFVTLAKWTPLNDGSSLVSSIKPIVGGSVAATITPIPA